MYNLVFGFYVNDRIAVFSDISACSCGRRTSEPTISSVSLQPLLKEEAVVQLNQEAVLDDKARSHASTAFKE